MITGEDIAAKAREYIGTPFHHQGRARGIGIDCAGLVLGVMHDLSLGDLQVDGYGRAPSPRVYLDLLRDNFDDGGTEILAGCVLSFAFIRHQQHLGIAVNLLSMIHAVDQHLCHEITLGEVWRRRLRGVYRYRGVRYG